MIPDSLEPRPVGVLRAQALERLREAAATGSGTVLGPAAMAALLRLAGDPAHAAEALVLQQELQLHQIEIDALSEALAQAREAPAAP